MKLRFLLGSLLVMLAVSAASGQVLDGRIRYVEGIGSQRAATPPDSVRLQLLPSGRQAWADAEGRFSFGTVPHGDYMLLATSAEGDSTWQSLRMDARDLSLEIVARRHGTALGTVSITDQAGTHLNWIRSVDGMGIYAARKCELILLDQVTANLATNNARQVFNRVPGLNIWENDGGGLQLGIGGRGLSPNRSSNFNTRQNGYDIAADALGYPESYYSPPVEALRRIEVVRGAASLQFGSQFGGMVNFVFKQGPEDRKVALTSRQTAGSYGFLSSFNSIGGQVAKGRLNYYAFYQGKRADGWRANSGYEQHTAFGSLRWRASNRVTIGGEYTYMHYLAQQAGGLTDAMFARDPRQSIRARNWFLVDWNLAALTADIALSSATKVNVRNFGLMARRDALGFLGAINRIDPGGNRDLISGVFQNFGSEARLMHKYDVGGRPSALLVGARYYQGLTTQAQGAGDAGDGPTFGLLHPEQPEGSDYTFPSRNVAAFAEQVLYLSDRWTLVPGVRYEYIHTASEGTYQVRNTDLAGNVIYEATVPDSRSRGRSVLLAGIGTAYKPKPGLEVYANIARNYRAITFNDMRVVNPNFEIDPLLKDERGFNADLGFRGQPASWLSLDASLFLLYYQDRIGQVLKTDPATFRYYRYRTNVADSRNVGLECYAEADIWRLLGRQQDRRRLAVFANVALLDARYISSAEPAFDGKMVELVPRANVKAGLDWRHGPFKANLQWTFVSEQFSDATNAVTSPTAVEGLIPAYQVLDLSAGYTWRWIGLEASCNNLLNAMYFTRRAAAYPGPGIIPSDGRSLFLTLSVQL